MKMTYTKSQYEMPDGKYMAKFLGVSMKELAPGEKPRLGEDGKPLPPAMTWDFEVVEGPNAGKRADKLTGRVPTAKSGCGKMLAAISDAILTDGQEIDLDLFVGKFYRITVVENRVSDNPAPVRVHDYVAAPVQSQAPNQQSAQQPAAGVPYASNPNARWDLSDGVTVSQNMTSAEVQDFFTEHKIDATKYKAKPAGAPRDQAKPADQYGFISGDQIPW